MNLLFFIIIIIFGIDKCFTLNSIIWDKKKSEFVPVSSVKEFSRFNYSRERKSTERRRYNFHGQAIRLVYFYDYDIFEFYENDRVTGICGDLWTILSEYLNFTLVVKSTNIQTLGTQPSPNENFTGLMGMLQREEYDVIPKMEAYPGRLQAVDFTNPFWKDGHRLFIKLHLNFKTTWMLDLFSWKIWCLIIVFYLLLSTFGIIARKYDTSKNSHSYLITTTTDYFFYSFGALCDQGDVLIAVQQNSKILSFCISMLSWLLITAFSSQLIIFMTQTVSLKPFHDLDTLHDYTDYTVLAEKYSIVHIGFMKEYRPVYQRINQANRIKFYQSHNRMVEATCSGKQRYAILQSEYKKMPYIPNCNLDAIGDDAFKTWIAAGLIKGSKYKKAIDYGILKLHEFGILSALKSRWLKKKDTNEDVEKYYSPINLNQVTLLFSVYLFGLCTSVVIVLIEKFIHLYN